MVDPDPDPEPPRRTGISQLSNKQIALLGVGVSLLSILVTAGIAIAGFRQSSPTDLRDLGDGPTVPVDADAIDVLEPFASLTHLSALVTLVDPDDLGSRTTREWIVNTAVTSPSGMLAVQVPAQWSTLDDTALPDGLDGIEGQMLIGWSLPEAHGFENGGEPGIAIASIASDDPAAALDRFPSPSGYCPAESTPARVIELEPALGSGAVRVLHDCEELDKEKYVWFQLALALVPPSDDVMPSTEVLTMCLTSTQDLAALGQMLASMQVSSPERALGPSEAE